MPEVLDFDLQVQKHLPVLMKICDEATAVGIFCELPNGYAMRRIDGEGFACRVRFTVRDKAIEEDFRVGSGGAQSCPEMLGMRVGMNVNIVKAVSEARRRLSH